MRAPNSLYKLSVASRFLLVLGGARPLGIGKQAMGITMNEQSMDNVVICMKWGKLYGPDYVNVLYRAVSDNVQLPFRFVCLTDDSSGIIDGVECYDIPDHGWTADEYRFGGWPKLSVFADDLYGLSGRAIFMDLDTVIVGDLTPMFQLDEGLLLIKEWKRLNDYFRNRGVRGMSSIFAYTIGAQKHLLERFLDDREAAKNSVRHEQAWITAHSPDMKFWPTRWIASFKKTLMAPPIVNRFVKPNAPDAEVRIVVFHGDPRPIDVVPDKGQRWGKWSRYGRGAVPFVREYWLKYGGKDPS